MDKNRGNKLEAGVILWFIGCSILRCLGCKQSPVQGGTKGIQTRAKLTKQSPNIKP